MAHCLSHGEFTRVAVVAVALQVRGGTAWQQPWVSSSSFCFGHSRSLAWSLTGAQGCGAGQLDKASALNRSYAAVPEHHTARPHWELSSVSAVALSSPCR